MKAIYKVISNKDGNDYERNLNSAGQEGFKVKECGYSRATQVESGGMFGVGSCYYPMYWAILERLDEN